MFPHTTTTIRLSPCRNGGKGRALLARLEGAAPAGAELYRVLDARAAERMVGLLREAGREARTLGVDRSAAAERKTLAWYAAGGPAALVAAGRTPFPDTRTDVRRLAVMNLPESLAAAAADLARAGADGLLAEADFFASAQDREYRLAELEKRGLEAEERRAALRALTLSVAWLEHDGCARTFLARYGQGATAAGPCGNCSWCLGKRGAFLP